MDNLTAPVYPSPTLFFPLKPDADPHQLYQDCKRGLARYLYQRPYLCGKIIKDKTGRNSIEIPPAPDSGAKFEYHDHRDQRALPSYDEFKSFGWPFADGNKDGLSSLCPKEFPSAQTGDPVIIPRFNVIQGGIVLTMSVAHVMCDLVQFMDLMKVWASNTRIVANARMRNQPEPSLPPPIAAHLMDRSSMTPDVQIEDDLDKLSACAADLSRWEMLNPHNPEAMNKMLESLFTTARLTDHDLDNYSKDSLCQPSVSVWKFPKSSIDIIKLIAQMPSLGKGNFSLIDCLTAFTWNRFFVAKQAPDEPGPHSSPKTTRIVYAASVRSRLTPPLPLEFLPACVDLLPVVLRTEDFSSASPRSLAIAATEIRRSNSDWSEPRFHKMLEVAQMHPQSPGIVPKGPLDALVTDHTRLGTVALDDWGPGLGQCEAYREPYFGRIPPRGEITFLPRWHDGEVSVMFAGEAVVMERLMNDQQMNAMASCQFVMHDFVRTIAKFRRSSKL
ncbi:hypothetical protein NW762_014568 [Fusarium torreyae]|uniref:Trichothecene 3-O-acetyltransferase-like N-terminal domain-containing protein n=1 Tax=Fusarium torreyae TaxID=1237075 RepID=A0A9W8RIJ1_9HYPO|nr:hypothetical protein NW762_014568 [Fusarium torreyae]